MHRITRLISSGSVALLVAMGGFASVTTPASAATQANVVCTAKKIINGISVPVSSKGSTNCLMSSKHSAQYAGTNALQTAINNCYISKGKIKASLLTVDGKFGSKTKDALIKVQKTLRVTQDGVYGVKTHNAMEFYQGSKYHGSTLEHTCKKDKAIK